ncbi:PAS domain-containing protein [Parasulfitobacter algicola]|uniref:PAS domain-containing protein n=1 Tax=Parasulfitobacter algicola TaxID=2614809 RepID=A0ABX2IR00_9RHOB|nr:PAS domain-containing protein [Sulfitobacter algicola]NSX55309.1 PAS domain-containing protein [Sulfitobacter algicola]
MNEQRTQIQSKDNVVSLFDFQPEQIVSSTDEVEKYWNKIRNGRMLPYRSDVDPRGIENSLEYAFIVERIAPGLARFRLTGSHLKDLMGMDVRGMPLTCMFTPESRKQMTGYIERLFDGPETISLSLTAETGMRRPQIFAKMVLLPLKSDLGDVSRALGCIVTQGKIGRSPRRFDIDFANCKLINSKPACQKLVQPQPSHQTETKKPDDIRPALTLLTFDN